MWLLKSEPDTFSIQDLARLGVADWDGVRNYQARNFINRMKPGDRGFFYHSRSKEPGIVGLLEIQSHPFPDQTALDPASPYFDPRSTGGKLPWVAVRVGLLEIFPQSISLTTLKQDSRLTGCPLLQRGQRLSVMPILPDHFQHILSLR
jgi:predicted RNA-binding protein with PUA-like domain